MTTTFSASDVNDSDDAEARVLEQHLKSCPICEAEVREAAILAMGASRRADAIEWLIAEFPRTPDQSGRKSILLSLSSSRVETAIQFLLNLVRTASAATSTLAADALSIHGRDEQLRSQVDAALSERTAS